MDRLTERRGDVVCFSKNGLRLFPMDMSSQDVCHVLNKLAEYEDAEEKAWRQNMKQIYVTMDAYYGLIEMGCIKPWTK